MEHYYVVTGNEYGMSIFSKKNFHSLEDAFYHYKEIYLFDIENKKEVQVTFQARARSPYPSIPKGGKRRGKC